MLTILNVTGPIYLSILAGFLATRTGFFTKDDSRVLSKFVLNFALPAMLFNALAKRSLDDILHPGYLLAYALGSLLVLGLGMAFDQWRTRRGLTPAALVGMGMSCSNSGYVGFPILLQLLGPAAGVGMALTLLVENLLVIPLCLALADSGESKHARWQDIVLASLRRLTRMPMLWAIVMGFVFSLLGLHLPDVLSRTINIFAVACSALALFVNGSALSGIAFKRLLREIRWVALGKLVLHPLLVGLSFLLVGPIEPSLFVSGIVLASMPMMSLYVVLGQRHGQEAFCAAAMLFTTVVSFFTISAILWALNHLPGWHPPSF